MEETIDIIEYFRTVPLKDKVAIIRQSKAEIDDMSNALEVRHSRLVKMIEIVSDEIGNPKDLEEALEDLKCLLAK